MLTHIARLVILTLALLLVACTPPSHYTHSETNAEVNNAASSEPATTEADEAESIPDGMFRLTVIYVYDGDSFKGENDEGETVHVRLYGIDAPEKNQDGGQDAKWFLVRMLAKKRIEVLERDVDRYNRSVAIVYHEGACVNETILREGHAWVYKRYCDDAHFSKWMKLVRKAQSEKKGLWSNENAIPPWRFRQDAYRKK